MGKTLGSVPTATEGEKLDERMRTYCLLFCSSDPTGEMLRIAMKLFPGEVRCSASKDLPGCVGTSVPCHTAVIKCMARAAEGRKGLAGLWIRGTAITEGRQWLTDTWYGHHCGETMAGVGDSWSHGICSEGAER